MVGAIGAYPEGPEHAFEMRTFAPGIGVAEDPVCGSMNASVGQWLTRTARCRAATASRKANGWAGLVTSGSPRRPMAASGSVEQRTPCSAARPSSDRPRPVTRAL
ncbi:PhzF family phenazine biosynthesis protein [Kribbella yunnanensis]|uniref:PhzF family phenazine biosynthesis protein n=1 Tax=Kribbella yunnanensis TaxID=190194 RepID=UPI0031E37E14